MLIRTAKGEMVDIDKYIAENEEMIALGNASMNARGDIVGRGGKVVTKREDIALAYNNRNPKAVKQVALKDLQDEVFKTPQQAVKELQQAAKAPARSPEPPAEDAGKPKRKISDAGI